MEKYAFKMRLNPGCLDEYRRRHDEIWPELLDLLRDTGVRDYSIYLDEEATTLACSTAWLNPIIDTQDTKERRQ